MTVIKLLLLAAIVVFALLAFRGSRRAIHKVLWRAYVVLVVLAAGVSVVYPDGLTTIAELVGVGRGADLLLYVLVVTFMLVSVVLFRRIGELERRYADVVRNLALQEALIPPRQSDRAS